MKNQTHGSKARESIKKLLQNHYDGLCEQWFVACSSNPKYIKPINSKRRAFVKECTNIGIAIKI